jgi:cyclohexanecarboxylate-CoA ligase
MRGTWNPSAEVASAYCAAGHWEQQPLIERIAWAATEFPDKPAVTAGDSMLTFAGLLERAGAVAGALVTLGVEPGDVVSFQLPNRVEAMVVFWATMLVGGVANPTMPIYRERELRFILGQARSKVVVFRPSTEASIFRRCTTACAPNSHGLRDCPSFCV